MAVATFLKIGDIQGESQDDRHRDEIEVLSWSWGVTQSASLSTGGGGGAGKPTFNDVAFTHVLDKSSPLLMKACATGQHLPEATLAMRKAGQGQRDYLVIKMSDVIVSSVSPELSAEAPAPTEAVTLRFRKVEFEYKGQRPDGSQDGGVRFGYDLTTNRPF